MFRLSKVIRYGVSENRSTLFWGSLQGDSKTIILFGYKRELSFILGRHSRCPLITVGIPKLQSPDSRARDRQKDSIRWSYKLPVFAVLPSSVVQQRFSSLGSGLRV